MPWARKLGCRLEAESPGREERRGGFKPEEEGDKVTWRLAGAKLPVGMTGGQARMPGQCKGIWVGLLRRLETRGQQARVKRIRGGGRPEARGQSQGGKGARAGRPGRPGPGGLCLGVRRQGPGGREPGGQGQGARARRLA